MLEKTRDVFSCSIARKSQQKYATAVRHLKAAEVTLGRSFSMPMTDAERAYLTAYMVGKGLQKETVQNYLSNLRFYELAQGMPNLAKNSELTHHILIGAENRARNPITASLKKERRPITIQMLRLIGHSLAVNEKWNVFEKSLIWTVALLAFWGSFRCGELCSEFRHQFDPKFALMPADIQFQGEAVAVWLRNKKVASRLGNIVEVWGLPARSELDPVIALQGYLRRRKALFGEAKDVPVFIHEDGSNLSKEEFNRDLKIILAHYPELSSSTRDQWAGHSFRSGLSTLLQSLGFDEAGHILLFIKKEKENTPPHCFQYTGCSWDIAPQSLKFSPDCHISSIR